MIEETLYTRLSTYANLTSLVSTRIYPNIAPQESTLPIVVYRTVSSVRETAMGSDPGIVETRVQLSCFGTTYSSAKNVAKQVRLATQRWSGTGVFDTFIDSEVDLYEPNTLYHHVMVDIKIHHTE